MVRRRLIYILSLLLVLLMNILYVESEFMVMLIVVIVVPTVSLIIFLFAMIGSKIYASVSKSIISVDDSVNVKLRVNNALSIPIGNGQLHFSVRYSNTDIKGDTVLSVADAVDDKGVIDISVAPEYSGIINIHIDKFELYDFLQLFKTNNEYKFTRRIVAIPELITADEAKLTSVDNINYDEVVKSIYTTDNSEVLGLREYLQGDPINRVHWNMSVKTGKLIVREYGEPYIFRRLILLDLTIYEIADFRNNLDRIYQAAYSLANYFIERDEITVFMAWDGNRNELVELEFIDGIGLIRSLIKMMEMECSEEALIRGEEAFKESEEYTELVPIIITMMDIESKDHVIINAAKDNLKDVLNNMDGICR